MRRSKLVSFGLVLAAAASVAAADSISITGAGATFPYPLYSKWFSTYNKAHPDIQINYQSIGSGGGIKQITARTVDFGASDAPLTDAELKNAPGLVHLPMVMGGVAVVYNLPSAHGLKMGPETLANIFLGKITTWNDPALAKENEGLQLPDTAISVAHRSDGSGTTAVFTDYLGKVSPEWKAGPGVGKSVKWPAGLGGKGNEGVAGVIKQSEGSIGYVELAYATQNALQQVALRNKSGNYVKCTTDAISAAGAGVELPADFRVSITDAAGPTAYPISSYTYLLLYKDQSEEAKGAALLQFLWWAVHDGQQLAPGLDYAPLPAKVVGKASALLESLTVNGKATLAKH